MRFALLGFAFTCLCLLPALPRADDGRAAFRRPDHVEFPESAPYSPQAAALGRMLFFDPRLSGGQNMSCASCHNPSFGWEAPVGRVVGALNQPLPRHVPTVENLAEASHLFWDGRAGSFEEQAIGPITNPLEMNANIDDVVNRLRAIGTYRRAFATAFPIVGLTRETMLQALATYERTLRSGRSPFDDWVEGEEAALSEAAKRGFALFVGPALCATCHTGWAFTDHSFHHVGIDDYDPGRGTIDPGAYRLFKTPGLRNIALRAPYMHDGSLPTLRDVVEHYRAGVPAQPGISPALSPAISEGEIDDLIAFLQSLTASVPSVSAPALPAE